MSPRSEEFMTQARERLAGAQDALRGNHAAIAASAAYYAMLYAARAALSERDLYAKTHTGVWSLFRRQFVSAGLIDPDLAAAADRAQKTRELGDYEARPPADDEARRILAEAELFVSAVAELLDA